MANRTEHGDEQWLDEWSGDLQRLDRALGEGPSVSAEEFQMLAAHTVRRKRRRMKYELALFMLTALLMVGGALMAALMAPIALILIHGIGMLAGITVLIISKELRSAGRRGFHE